MGDRHEGGGPLADGATAQLGDPHSVTTLSTVFLTVVTTSPAANVELILEMWPSSVVECSTTNPCPPSEYMAPRAKSA
jgi:hypothetical protein